ncbi:cpt_2 [Blepharisma stoltei]|uniref:Peptidase M14 domain-containing protein n=1 Tax=Blepharisma stoltei TaxID=1481888 RepID=A0AAU9ITY2_9CILI|nr:unnamed protein product [Blepharisma stoltei]
MVLPLILFLAYFAYSWDDSNLANGYLRGYFNMTEITAQLNSFTSPDLSLITLGKSVDGNNIEGIKLLKADGISSNLRTKILITGTHTTKQLLATTQVLYLLNFLTNDTSPNTLYLVQTSEIYFIPVINVDSYIAAGKYYITTNTFKDFDKNTKNTCSSNVEYSGVNLNRNFDSHWGADDTGSSSDPCSNVYRGASAFSEPETSALKTLISTTSFKMWIHYGSYGNHFFYPYCYLSNVDPSGAFKNISSYIYFRNLPYSANLLWNASYGTTYSIVKSLVNGALIDYGMDNNIYSFWITIGAYQEQQANILPNCRNHTAIFKQIALTSGPLNKMEFGSISEEICKKNEACTINENAYAYVTLWFKIMNLGLSDSYADENFIFKATYGSTYSYEIANIIVGNSAATLSYTNISDSSQKISFEVNIGSIPALSNTNIFISFYSYKNLTYDGEEMTINYQAKLTSSLTANYSALSFSDSSVVGKATQPSTAINTENYGAFYYIRVSSEHHELAAVAAICVFIGIFMIAVWVLIAKIFYSEQIYGNHNTESHGTMAGLNTKNATVEHTLIKESAKPENNLNGFRPMGSEIKNIGQEPNKFQLELNTGEGSPSQRGKISIPNSLPKSRENIGRFREFTLGEDSPSTFVGIGYGMPRAGIRHDIDNPEIRSARQEGLSIPMRAGLISKNEPEIKGNINVPGFGPLPPELDPGSAQRGKINVPPHMKGTSFGNDPSTKLEIVDAPQLPIFAGSPTDFSAKNQEKKGFSPMVDPGDLRPNFGSPQAKAGGFGGNIVEEAKLPFAVPIFRGSTGEGPSLSQVSIPPSPNGEINLGNPNSKGSFQPINPSFGEEYDDIEILVDDTKSRGPPEYK